MKRWSRRRKTLVAAAAIAVAVTAGAIHYYRATHLKRFGVVAPGVLYRSRQPRGLQWAVLDRFGIRTVVNLCMLGEGRDEEEEERQVCADAGVELVRIPVGGTVVATDQQIEAFLKVVRRRAGPVLVHCQHGRARTGITVAAYRVVVDGWPVAKAVAEMDGYGHDPSEAQRNEEVRLLSRLRQRREAWLQRTRPEP